MRLTVLAIVLLASCAEDYDPEVCYDTRRDACWYAAMCQPPRDYTCSDSCGYYGIGEGCPTWPLVEDCSDLDGINRCLLAVERDQINSCEEWDACVQWSLDH